MLPRLVRALRDGGTGNAVAALDDQPPRLPVEARTARWLPCPARAAKNSFQDPGCVANAQGPPSFDRRPKLRSAAFLSNESILYNFCFSRPGIGIAAIA